MAKVEVVLHVTAAVHRWIDPEELGIRAKTLSENDVHDLEDKAFQEMDLGDAENIDGELAYIYDENGKCLYDCDKED